MTSALQHLAVARRIVAVKLPYFASALTSLAPVAWPGSGTLGVTARGVLLYDPEAVERWAGPELAAVLVHEVLHVCLGHPRRGAGLDDHLRANLAADMVVNPMVRDMGLKLPGDPVWPRAYDLPEGQTVDWYYGELEKRARPQKPGVGAGACGGCAGNPSDEPAEAGDAARSDAELAVVRRAVAEAVRQHAAQGKGRGTVPAGLARWAEAQLAPPQVPWQVVLARTVRAAVGHRAGSVDYSYARPSRRHGAGPGLPLHPAMVCPVPRVAVAVDTSGSVSDAQLGKAIAEVAGILRATGAPTAFYSFDHEAHRHRGVATPAQARAALVGGGGTNFEPAFELARREPGGVDVLVVMTDGLAPAPARPAKMRVIWLLLGADCRAPCDWGDAINVE